MSGFTVCFSKNSLPETVHCREKKYFPGCQNSISKSIRSQHYFIDYYSNSKFQNDKTVTDTGKFIICNEGVILNLEELLKKYEQADIASLIQVMYLNNPAKFPDEFRGDFSGFIFEKESGRFYIYTNQIGSKRVFYFHQHDVFIFSSDLGEISHLLHEFKFPFKLNTASSLNLLTHGFMPDENTLIQGVNRLLPGCTLEFSFEKEIKISNYFHLKHIEKTTDSHEDIIEKMDNLFSQAVKREFEKDKSYGYKHVATLSGGLDSRMVVLMAHKLGYKEQLNFTFSQANYLDEQIAKKIAVDHRHDFLFQSLDGGNYLKNADNCAWLNDGLVLYSGSAHLLHALQNINFEDYGLIHTGLVGDAVIGSFLSAPEIVLPSPTDGMYSKKLASKTTERMKEIVAGYDSEEIYKFYTRGFLGAMNGNYTIDLYTQSVSPFLDVDFVSYCISIPEKFKYKQKIYLEWIAAKHPEFARYPWEKTGVSPLKSNNFKKYFDLGYYKRMSLKFFDKLSGKMKSGMNPFDFWMQQNKSLELYINTYFNNHIALLSFNTELQNDCKKLYQEGNSGEKFQVLTLLAAVKLHQCNG